ncbi:C-type lectin 37Da-like [Drosophila subpulchrella]|uniref:C-type lectin 37Da-like n=1 Tax=Drosophila subpulchrella TaxID=1486046 RepID=UPI0018A18580|nr:C-type lectin 37Da-like [Drosophila subpulchrella]
MLKTLIQLVLTLASFELGFSCDKCSTGILSGNLPLYAIKSIPFVKINEGYYHFGQEKVNWYRGYENCRKLGSDLVAFETPQEFDAVIGYLKGMGDCSDYWTSGNDLAQTGSHNWFTNALPININRWARRQPNNIGGNQHCVHLGYVYKSSTNFQLNDCPCKNHKKSSMKYVCEVPMQGPTSFVVGK